MAAPIPNSGVSITDTTSLQLSYVVQTNPNPLQASSGSDDEATLASLQIVISSAASVDVTQIEFVITVGTGASLMQTTDDVDTYVSDTTTWQFNGPSSPVSGGTATFSLLPASGNSATIDGTLVAEISDFETVVAPATTTITIKEFILNQTTPNIGTITVTTFPVGFFFSGLTASTGDASQLTPVAAVAAGTAVTLTWNSSAVDTTAILVYYTGGPAGGENPPSPNSWTSPALEVDTVFTVVVSGTEDDGPITMAASIPVSVTSANITPATVDVTAGTLIVGSSSIDTAAVTVNGSSNATITIGSTTTPNSGVTINSTAGTSILSGQDLSVANLTPALWAASQTPLYMQGDFQIMDGAKLYMPSGSLLSATGATISLLNYGASLPAGTYQAITDGFVVGVVSAPSDASDGAFGWVSALIGQITAYATGGNLTCDLSGGGFCNASNNGSFTLPIPNTSVFSVNINVPAVGSSACQQAAPTTGVYWFPMGTGYPTVTNSLVHLGDAPEHPRPRVTHMTHRHDVIDELLDALGDLVGAPLEGDRRERLAQVLRRF